MFCSIFGMIPLCLFNLLNFYKLAIECFKGKSLWRILSNFKLSEFKVFGDLLDAGSKDISSSYYRYLDSSKVKSFTFLDYYSNKNKEILKIDLEKKIPIVSGSYDSIILMNALEHVYNFKLLLKELFRITRPGGLLIGAVPFIFRFHANPNDYYRFTHTCLYRNLLEAGYEQINISTIGNGIFIVLAEQISRYIPSNKIFSLLRFLIWYFLINLSEFKIFNKEDINYNKKEVSYLGLVFKCKKQK